MVLLISVAFPIISGTVINNANFGDTQNHYFISGNILVSPSKGAIYNPFGVTTSVVNAEVEIKHILMVKLWAENVPDGLTVEFNPSVVYFKNNISSIMTIYGKTVKNGTYDIKIIVEWMSNIYQCNRQQTNYQLSISSNFSIKELPSWTKNPSLKKDIGLWDNRTSRWNPRTKTDDHNPSLTYTYSKWDEDGNASIYVKDSNKWDLGCECAALSQGKHHRIESRIYGTELEPVKNSDVEEAYIVFNRSNFGVIRPTFLYTAGNIIDFWMTAPNGSFFGIDLYFETKGPNNFLHWRNGEAYWAPSQISKVYMIRLFEHPEYWIKNTSADGKESWIIDLKSIIERASKFTGWNLSDFEWRHVDFISESATFGFLRAGVAWQSLHYFVIKIDKK